LTFEFKMTDEEKMVLWLSNPFFTEKHQAEIKSILLNNNQIDPSKIYSIAVRNGTAGFVFKNAQGLNIFPDNLSLDLHKFYKQTAFKNILMLQQTIILLKLLADNKIVSIPLKGAAASDLLFNDFGVYPSGDIDILVHPSNLPKAKKILCTQGGFSQIREIAEQDLLLNHYHLIFKKDNLILEVHWNLVKRYFSIPPDFWWQTSKAIEWNGIHTVELSIEKYILYNIFRLFDHCFYPLRFFSLLSGIIDKNADNINWNELMHYARHYKMQKLVIFTLRLIKEMLNTPVPENLFLKKYMGYQYFRSLVFSGIFSGIQKKHQKMMVYTVLLIQPGTVLAILVKRIFPAKGELRLRYNLPPESNKLYFYYILNPLLLIFKKRTNHESKK